MADTCECHGQIVWFFDKPTIYVCEACEKTVYYKHEKCPTCKGKLTEFVKKQEY